MLLGQSDYWLLEKFQAENNALAGKLRAEKDRVFGECDKIQESDPNRALEMIRDFLNVIWADTKLSREERKEIITAATERRENLKLATMPKGKPESNLYYSSYLERKADAQKKAARTPHSYLTIGGQPAGFFFFNRTQWNGFVHNIMSDGVVCTINEKTYRYHNWQVPVIQVSDGAYLYHPVFRVHFYVSNEMMAMQSLQMASRFNYQNYSDTSQSVSPSSNYSPPPNIAPERSSPTPAGPPVAQRSRLQRFIDGYMEFRETPAGKFGEGLALHGAAKFADRRGYSGTAEVLRELRDNRFEAAINDIFGASASEPERQMVARLISRGVSQAFDGKLSIANLAEATARDEVMIWLRGEEPGLEERIAAKLAPHIVKAFQEEQRRRIGSTPIE